jgi:DNA-binding beta-propeller fold protein YncE
VKLGSTTRLVLALVCAFSLALPSLAAAAPSGPAKSKASAGSLVQLAGAKGCVAGGKKPAQGCARARALKGPGSYVGSRALAVSPDGRNLYVASSISDAITVFRRNPKTGVLSQASGAAGCVAVRSTEGCGAAIGLDAPNSVAVSPDGRTVYATARDSSSIAVFHRSPKTGMLTQLPGPEGCLTGLPQPTSPCANARALAYPDVVVVSPDGRNVYVGAFFGNGVVNFAVNPASGGLTQLDGSAGCIVEGATNGCAAGIALGNPEGLGISNNGGTVYAAAASSGGVAILTRDASTGALAQVTNGRGCIVNAPLSGCTTGVQLGGANAVAVSPRRGTVYISSFQNSVTSFAAAFGGLTQLPGTSACLVYLRAVGCSFGRAIEAPEGIAVSPDGSNVYTASIFSNAVDVLARNPRTGAVFQKPGRAGCLAAPSLPGCTPARATKGVSSVVVSPDGKNVYATAFASSAVDVFRRVK